MSRKRKNAGEGYGYMFHGAFKDKAKAESKERRTKGAWIKHTYTPQGWRYIVMSPRTNPIRRKKKAPRQNPNELLIMAANPHEITAKPGETITIRVNPENPAGSFHPALLPGRVQRRVMGRTPFNRRVAAMVRKARAASGMTSAEVKRLEKSVRAGRKDKKKLEGLFHELYGHNPAPICGHMIGGEQCTRKPGHRGPHLPQGATMRTRHRLRKGWRPNPSAAALRENFTGTPSDWIEVSDQPHMPAGDYAQLGQLLALYVKPAKGGQILKIDFGADRPIVVCAENARQLFFIRGDQDVSAALSGFGALDRGNGLFTLGEATRIDYKQRKAHVPQPEQDEWRHEFGEESGVRPVLVFDSRTKHLLLEGGEYVVRTEGIVN